MNWVNTDKINMFRFKNFIVKKIKNVNLNIPHHRLYKEWTSSEPYYL